MQRNLVDYSVYYKKEDIRIPNVINAYYEEINNGFNANNEVNYVINVKLLFVDANGLLRCIEDDADQFIFYEEICTTNGDYVSPMIQIPKIDNTTISQTTHIDSGTTIIND